MNRLIVIVFILLTANITQAQRTQASVSSDTMRMLIGDQTKIRLQANHNPNKSVVYPELTQQNLGGLMVIDIARIDTIKKTPTVITEQAVTVAAFDSGFYKIPPLPYKVYFNGKLQETVYSKPVEIIVSTMVVDTTYMAAIKPIQEAPYTFSEFIPYLIGLLFLLALGFILFRIRNSKQEEVEQPEIIIPAHEIANTKLFKLKEEKLWQQGKIKEYHSQVTYIVREYLENRFGVNALEYTTEETIRALKNKDFDESHKNKLREILQRADLVKFAKDKPGPEVHEEAMTVAKDFVKQTKKVIDLTVDNTTTVDNPTNSNTTATNTTVPEAKEADKAITKIGSFPITVTEMPIDDTRVVKKDQLVENRPDPEQMIKSEAEKFITTYNETVDGELDYSTDSLELVEQILGKHHLNLDKLDQPAIKNLMSTAGSYIFEVAQRKHGGKYAWYWKTELNQPTLVTGEPDFKVSILAFDRVEKRIKYGKDEHIPFYFKSYENAVKTAKKGDQIYI